ncbi:angiopoietin-related protein 6 isoform X2 [Vanacampus margaritifer]
MSTMEHTTLTGLILLSALSLELLQANGLRSIRETTEKHPPSSSDVKADRCSYTFIVPQQKLSGALCLDTKAAATAANQSEVAALRAELKRQQEQLRSLQTSLEQEGSFITEMRILRKESSGMNSRIAQLYSQLLQEVINKKDQALEQRRVENLLLNATTHALQVSGNFRELEKKYGALMSMMSSQSQLIARLEKQCQCKDESLSDLVPTEPPRSQSSTLLNDSSEISNDLQRDLSALQQDNPLGALLIPSTTASPSTAQPVISFPVTKTPGPWRDCQHVLESGETTSGIYLLRLQNANRLLQAWCEQNHAQGGWTVIQRSKALGTWMASTGWAWSTCTGWPNKPNTSCAWFWTIGRVDRCSQSTTASGWSRRATGTDCGWDSIGATQVTRFHGTTTRPSPLWIGTKTATQVTVPTTRKEAGGTTCAPTPISTVCGIGAVTIAVATRTACTGRNSTEGPTHLSGSL